MNCFTDLTYSIYLDHELSAEECRTIDAHLAICPSCRAQVERLRLENQVIAEALEVGAEGLATVPGNGYSGFPLAWVLPVMMGGVIALSWTVQWISGNFPASADWFNPFNRTAILNFFLSFAFFLSVESQAILHWFGLAVTSLAVGLLVAGGIYLLLRRWPLHFALLGAVMMFVGPGKPAYAIETRNSGQTVTVPPSETVADSLEAGAQYVEIAGRVNGNLIAHGQKITISGTVTGDVITSSQTLDIEGTVQGNVFAWAQFVTVHGKVGQSVHVFAESLEIADGGQVGGDVIAFCQTLNVNGDVKGGVAVGAANVMLRGNVDHGVYASAGQVRVASSAHIGQNLVARVHRTRDFSLDPGAVVGGKTEVKLSGNRVSRFLTLRYYLWRAVELCAVWLTGLVLFWLFPSLFTGKMENSSDLLKAMGWGFVLLVVTPVAAVMAALTVVGLPLAIMALILWILGLFLVKIFLAPVIGNRLMGTIPGAKVPFAVPLLLGLVVIFVAVALPYIGKWDSLLVALTGFGLVLSAARDTWRRRRQLSA
ncbi:MAG TPA: zf-HC2 domain-containing protein [Terriglobia bacterium]|nr:zf-HC2 domain-containing protein [Terriglobia bacterium]